MASFLVRIFFNILGFIPFILIPIINNWANNQYIIGKSVIIIVSILLASVLLCIFLIYISRKSIPHIEFDFCDITPASHEVLMYGISFITAFATYTTAQNIWIAIIILFGVFSTINQFCFNPLFLIFGYGFYNVKSKNGTSYLLITKKELLKPQKIAFARLNRYILLDL